MVHNRTMELIVIEFSQLLLLGLNLTQLDGTGEGDFHCGVFCSLPGEAHIFLTGMGYMRIDIITIENI